MRDLKGLQFGKWIVLEIILGYKKENNFWLCRCECGNEKVVYGQSLIRGSSKSCGCINSPDLAGKNFGRLLVIKKLESRKRTNGNIGLWECRCDCGNVLSVTTNSLTSGNTKSCGCYNRDIFGYSRFIDMVGNIYGNLTVIKRDEANKNGQPLWTCKCACGNFTKATSGDLRGGGKKSCGCLSESWVAKGLKDYFVKNYKGIAEYRVLKNPKTGRFLPFDIYLPNYKIFIEVNGNQHYIFYERYHKDQEGFEYSKQKDEMKKKFAKKNGIYIEIDLRKVKTVEKAIEKIERKIEKIKVQ